MITLQLHSDYALQFHLQSQPTQKEVNVMHWANRRYFCFHLLQRASSVSHLNTEIAQNVECTCPIHHLTEAISDYITHKQLQKFLKTASFHYNGHIGSDTP